jgi:transcriptional regulator with XRE-family HTH domain
MGSCKFRKKKPRDKMNFMDLFNIGKAIREIRKEKNMSLGDVFKITGIERSSLSRIESGKTKYPRLITILDIAAALKVKPREIIHRAVVEEPGELRK